MRSLVITEKGSPVADRVRLIDDAPTPAPAAGELLIRTEASALNHLDLWVGRGLPGIDTKYPFASGSDGCGVVETVGAGVDAAWVGQRVLMNAAVRANQCRQPDSSPAGEDISMIGEHVEGANREFFTAPVSNVLAIGNADPIQAVAVGLTHLTAWRMLTTRAQVRSGEIVLVTGIGGGVALAALALAKHLGCRVIVTSRSQEKLDRAAALGADAGLLDTGADWSKAVRGLTNRRGVDVIIESIGAAVHGSCLKSLARAGRLVTCGCTTGAAPPTDLARVFWNQLSILGSTMGSMEEFAEVVALWSRGRVCPVVDSVHRPADGACAFSRLESGNQFGKVVIDWR
ncbi:MAG: zinc-binding dehydrogenase [Planctomycetota bacterium]|nr:zinc-binding dehydrogenase [Planctomycetota bacterium]MDA1106272.1 zinc-binding dehydrogenase [Planctomycetota bacterium]